MILLISTKASTITSISCWVKVYIVFKEYNKTNHNDFLKDFIKLRADFKDTYGSRFGVSNDVSGVDCFAEN